MNRVSPQHPAAYLRISQDDEATGAGVDRQREDVLALARRLDWPEPVFYVDNDRSAYKDTVVREGWVRLLADLSSAGVDGLLAYNLDRVARQPVELEALIKLVEGKAPTHAVTGMMDLSNDAGITTARMMVSFANLESRNIGRRVKRKHAELAQQGRPAGGLRPYGFAEDRITHRPEEADIVREMARRVLSGESLTSLANDLNERGSRPPRAKLWTTTSIKALLVAPRAAGLRALGGVETEAVWAPIIERDEWRTVVAILGRHGARPAAWNSRRHLLAGFLICAECRTPLRSKRTSHAGVRYVCPPRTMGGCAGVSRSAVALEAAVEAWALVRLGEIELEQRPETDPAVEALRGVEGKIKTLDALYEAGEVEDLDYFRHLKTLRVRAKELSTKAERRFSLAGVVGTDPATAWADSNLAQRRAILGALLEVVSVGRVAKRDSRRALELETIQIIPK